MPKDVTYLQTGSGVFMSSCTERKTYTCVSDIKEPKEIDEDKEEKHKTSLCKF